jgi:heptosyltransferase-1
LTRVLLIKTSSLGDVIHCLPSVSDMARHVADLELEWVIEDDLAGIAALHPAVRRIIRVRQRRWRRRPWALETRREFVDFLSAIREKPYDRVVDAQGLMRTALLARLAPGPHCGYDWRSVREPLASLLYDRRYPASVTIHAAERMRRLAAQALGYPLPAELDYGLDAPSVGETGAKPYLVALHATARPDKAWAEANWIELTRRAASAGFNVMLPWGGEAERAAATRIATAGGTAPERRLSFADLAALFAGAAAVVGVDTGLTHLASAVGTPVVAVYAASWADFNGVIGPGYVANLGGPGDPPSLDEVWGATEAALRFGRKTGPWRAALATPVPQLDRRRRFRPPPSNARAVVHRR